MVKVTNHIKGNINTKDNCLEFIYDEVDDNDEDMNNQILYVNIEDDISYDKDYEMLLWIYVWKAQKR
jgi:hypothetical protein